MSCTYYGRKKIFSIEDDITAENVWDVVQSALSIHNVNKRDMTYLYDYYKGDQPILYREKEIRPEICNKIVMNRAYEIVSFKRGYLLTENIQYIRKGDSASKEQPEEIRKLNEYMDTEGKATKDSVLAEWMYITGTGYRAVFAKSWVSPDDPTPHDEDDAPFDVFTLDPRECFVAYSRSIGNAPVFACVQSKPVNTVNEDGEYTVYTADKIFSISNGNVISTEDNALGYIPIVEYPENNSRLGAFEIVLGILDSINLIESNALDDIEQVVQALLVLIGVDIETKDADGNTVNTIDAIRAQGGISIPEGSDAKYLTNMLNQGSTKSLAADLESAWLEICGMPNRNGGSSTSDTGAAVQLRDGWSSAEVMAMNTQTMWAESEKQFLRIVLKIIGLVEPMSLKPTDIIPHFNRQNAVNIQSKVQAFTGLVAAGLDKRDCVKISGIAFDVESVVENWKKAEAEAEKKQMRELQESMKMQDTEDTDSQPDEVKQDEET
jgi:SPP1 family phage portal protein